MNWVVSTWREYSSLRTERRLYSWKYLDCNTYWLFWRLRLCKSLKFPADKNVEITAKCVKSKNAIIFKQNTILVEILKFHEWQPLFWIHLHLKWMTKMTKWQLLSGSISNLQKTWVCRKYRSLRLGYIYI